MGYFRIGMRGHSGGAYPAVAQPSIAPHCTQQPSITGVSKDGNVLSRVAGLWAGTSPIAIVWQWTANGADIAGQTGDTIFLTPGAYTGEVIDGYEKATSPAGGPITANSSNSKTVVGGSQIVLGQLSFSQTIFTPGQALDGAIYGTTTGSTISSANLPACITIDGAARTFHYDGTSGVSGTLTLEEDLAAAMNSGRTSTISFSISSGGLGSPTVDPNNLPTLSCVPREGEVAWGGAGIWPGATSYRFTLKQDGVAATGWPITQSADACEFIIPASAVDTAISLTVEASNNGGSSWSAPVTALNSFTFASDIITPATRATPVVTRLTSSGTIPMQVQIDGTFYDSDILTIEHYNSSDTLLEKTEVGFSDNALTAPFTIDLSGQKDPFPFNPLSPSAAGDYYKFGIITPDYNLNDSGVTSGVASGLATVGVSDAAGSRYWGFLVSATSNGFGPILRQIETATSVGGANNATGRISIYIPAGCQIDNGGGHFDSSHFFSGTPMDGYEGQLDASGGFPVMVVRDYGANIDLHELRLIDHSDYSAWGPTAFQFGPCDAAGTYSGAPPVDQTGVIWDGTQQTKTYDW